MMRRHVAPQGGGSGVRLGFLDEAAVHIRHAVRPRLIEPHFPLGRYGVLALVPVAESFRRTQNFLHLHAAAAHAAQGVLHPLALGCQLLGIVHVAEGAAAAAAVVGAVRLHTVGRHLLPAHDLAVGGVFQHFHH